VRRGHLLQADMMLTDMMLTDTSAAQYARLPFGERDSSIVKPSQAGIGGRVAGRPSPSLAQTLNVFLAGRNESKIASVMDAITATNSEVEVKVVPLNLLSHKSVHAAVDHIRGITSHDDFLINNAGAMATRNFVLSEDNIASQFPANYLIHSLLTNLLVKDGLVGSDDVTLNVGSLGYQMADVDYDNINLSNIDT
jgi:NADP-dependent 3-hydroxy acid dehydrogenase YdfG